MKRKGVYQLVSGKNVCKVVCMGDKDRIICNSQQKRFVNERSCYSYRAHIRRVIKKEEAPLYKIDGNSNLRHNDNCLLNTCFGNTTLRRKILSKLKPSPLLMRSLEGFLKITQHQNQQNIRQESTARCNRSREGLSRSIHKDRLFD